MQFLLDEVLRVQCIYSSDKVSANYSLWLGLLNIEEKPSVNKKTVDRTGQ